MMKDSISKANMDDLQEILNLQYLAYQSEAALFGNKDIPPLKQTLDEVIEEYHKGIILKMVDTDNLIIGSIAQNNGMQAIRLDALASNTPAHKIYERLGFEYRGKQHLYAENTGWMDFDFFEYKSDNTNL